jgi:hypothetical protein
MMFLRLTAWGRRVVQERFAFQLGFIAFADEGETQELQGLTVNVQARTRRAQRQGHAHAVLADGEHFGIFLARALLLPPLGLLIAWWVWFSTLSARP